MRIKNISFIMMLMAVFVTGSVYADIVVSNLSENTVRRLSPDGALVWQDTAGARSTNQMTFGPDENGNPDQLIFASREGTDKMLATRDAWDGTWYDDRFNGGTHTTDAEWGPDYNGDGKAELYVASRDTIYVVDVDIVSLDVVDYNELTSFYVPDDGNSIGTGGKLFFGPDMNSDGTGDLFSMKGGNSNGNRINVWDPLTGVKIATYNADDCRGIGDAILGPDMNSDGQEDLWVVNHYRNNINAYDLNNGGAQLGTVFAGGGVRGPLDIVEAPDGMVYISNRFGTDLSTGGTASSYGNVLKYDPVTQTRTQIYELDGSCNALAYTPIELEPFVEIIPEAYDFIANEYGTPDPNNPNPYIQQQVRFNNAGNVVWSSTVATRSVFNLTLSADEQLIFTSKQGTDKMLSTRDAADGTWYDDRFNSGTHMVDSAWGPDYNSDGKDDLYVSGRNELWVVDVTVNALDDVVYTELAEWIVADTDPNIGFDGTGGNLTFGHDMNSDGVGDLFAMKGGNSAGNRINVWDPMTGAKIVTYPAEECRGIGDGAFVNDQNRDGVADLWVADHYRNTIKVYDGANGSFLGTMLSAMGQPTDLELAPDGTVYITTRSKSSLNASYDDPSSLGADVIRHNPSTGESWLVATVDGPEANGYFTAVTVLSATCALDSVADMDDDCDVDIDDLIAFVGQWLMSTDPAP